MKTKYIEHHIKEHLDELYDNAIIVLDTNSILNLYRYNDDNRNKYFEILNQVKDRIYLTHQICQEFYANRLTIIRSRAAFKDSLSDFIQKEINSLIKKVEECNDGGNSTFLSILKHEESLKSSIAKELTNANKKIEKNINGFKQSIDIDYIQKNDPILEELVKVISSKISDEIPESDKQKIYKDGEERYKNQIPPGFKDKEKPSPKKFGDLLIWNELQNISKEKKVPILFISDDRKDDWVLKLEGKDLGTRTELIREFNIATGNLFYSISTTQFIQIISKRFSITDTSKLEEETESIQKNIEEKENAIFVHSIAVPDNEADYNNTSAYINLNNHSSIAQQALDNYNSLQTYVNPLPKNLIEQIRSLENTWTSPVYQAMLSAATLTANNTSALSFKEIQDNIRFYERAEQLKKMGSKKINNEDTE